MDEYSNLLSLAREQQKRMKSIKTGLNKIFLIPL